MLNQCFMFLVVCYTFIYIRNRFKHNTLHGLSFNLGRPILLTHCTAQKTFQNLSLLNGVFF